MPIWFPVLATEPKPTHLRIEATFVLADEERSKDWGVVAAGAWSRELPPTFQIPESILMSQEDLYTPIGGKGEFFCGDTIHMTREPIKVGASIVLDARELPGAKYRINYKIDWDQLLGVRPNGKGSYDSSVTHNGWHGYHVVKKDGQIAIRLGRQVSVEGYVPGDSSRLTKYSFAPREKNPKEILLVLSLGEPTVIAESMKSTGTHAPLLPRPIGK